MAQGGDHGLAFTGAVTDQRAGASGLVMSWCSQPAMLTASSAPHIHASARSRIRPAPADSVVANTIIAGQKGTYHHLSAGVVALLPESGLTSRAA